MSNFEEDPKRPGSEATEQAEPDLDRPVQGDATEYIEKGLKEGEIEKLEERDE
ncbi:MAG TPA: hypothetical protein VI039_07055 [Solirubrobacterales bacterium]